MYLHLLKKVRLIKTMRKVVIFKMTYIVVTFFSMKFGKKYESPPPFLEKSSLLQFTWLGLALRQQATRQAELSASAHTAAHSPSGAAVACV